MLAHAKTLLAPLGRDIVFVGGATVHLHVDDPAAAPVRRTRDVDVVIAVVNYVDFSRAEAELREHGFEQLVTDDSPICRWTKDGLLLDVIPTRPDIIGFAESRWFEEGFVNAMQHKLPDGDTIAVFDVLHLLAAKIEAFRERGDGDLYASRDFEDIATILDGNRTVWDELAREAEVATFVRRWLRGLDPVECEDAIAGHVGDYARASLLLERIDGLPS
jgi:predicted nucleotidyltransferase